MHLQMKKKKEWKKKKNPICYIKSFCCTIPKLNIYIYILKHLQKTIPSLKFNMNANTYEKSYWQGPNFVRSNQESLSANSLVININDATKRKKWMKAQKLNKYERTKLQTWKMKKQLMIIDPLTSFTSVIMLQWQSIEETRKTRCRNETLYHIP